MLSRSIVQSVTRRSFSTLDKFWLPFTNNKEFLERPRLLSESEGMYYNTPDGRKVMDACAGLWCVNIGHQHPKVKQALHDQVERMMYAPSFNVSHPLAFEFADKLLDLVPDRNFGHVFFTNDGSSSVDSALKIAIAYHQAKGNKNKTRFIGRERAYHGVGFGGISVGGITPNRKVFHPVLLPSISHLPHTHDLDRNAFSRGQPLHGGEERANALENIIALHDPQNIACVIVEPVAGSTGVLLPPVGYLQRLREICDKHDILLIFDEVITGFGRTGSAFGTTTFDVTPDMIVMAKGMTSGFVPCGGVMTQAEIFQTIQEDKEKRKDNFELYHGYTYSAHPLACAAGLATLQVYEEEKLFDRSASLAPLFEQRIHSLADISSHIIDIRNIGLMGAIEFSTTSHALGAGFANELFRNLFHRDRRGEGTEGTEEENGGMLVRVTGNTIALTPPLVITEEEMNAMFDMVEEQIKLMG